MAKKQERSACFGTYDKEDAACTGCGDNEDCSAQDTGGVAMTETTEETAEIKEPETAEEVVAAADEPAEAPAKKKAGRRKIAAVKEGNALSGDMIDAIYKLADDAGLFKAFYTNHTRVVTDEKVPAKRFNVKYEGKENHVLYKTVASILPLKKKVGGKKAVLVGLNRPISKKLQAGLTDRDTLNKWFRDLEGVYGYFMVTEDCPDETMEMVAKAFEEIKNGIEKETYEYTDPLSAYREAKKAASAE